MELEIIGHNSKNLTKIANVLVMFEKANRNGF